MNPQKDLLDGQRKKCCTKSLILCTSFVKLYKSALFSDNKCQTCCVQPSHQDVKCMKRNVQSVSFSFHRWPNGLQDLFFHHTNGFSQSIWSTSLFFHVFSSHPK